MTESKIELTERLRREGRWAEASKLKDEAIKEAKKAGMKSDEAKDAGWEAMEKAYPPLPSTAEPEHGDDETEEKAAGRAVGPTTLPVAWGELPDSAPLDVEVEWVHQNRVLVVEERASGKSLLHWERARKPAPGYGAVNLMEFAATNRKGFMDILQRVKPGENGDEENVRREKKSIAEIRGILEQLNQKWAEELAANVPETVKAKVRGIMEDWARRSALMIPNEAKADLEAHIADLVQRCMVATGKVEAGKETEEKKAAHIGEALAGMEVRE